MTKRAHKRYGAEFTPTAPGEAGPGVSTVGRIAFLGNTPRSLQGINAATSYSAQRVDPDSFDLAIRELIWVEALEVPEGPSISQRELARRSGVSQAVISNLVTGGSDRITLRTGAALAGAVGRCLLLSFEQATGDGADESEPTPLTVVDLDGDYSSAVGAHFRTVSNITQRAAAARIGVTQAAVWDFVHGTNDIGLERIGTYFDSVGVNVGLVLVDGQSPTATAN